MIIESEKIGNTSEGSLVGTFTAITKRGRKLYAVVTENVNKTGCYWIQNEKNKVIHDEFNLSDFNAAWHAAKNHVLNKDKKPSVKTTYKIYNGKKFLSVQAQKKTGGRYDLLVQELNDKGALLWIRKERFYKGRQVTGGGETIVWNGFNTFSEAVRCGRTHILNLIGGNKKCVSR